MLSRTGSEFILGDIGRRGTSSVFVESKLRNEAAGALCL